MDISTGEQIDLVFRFLIAGSLGACIGMERELRGYPAGIRTTALVAAGASLFTDLSTVFGDAGSSRIASNVVVGIGFIGAGVILRDRGRIRGITTAATIWVAAAIGMAIGSSLYIVGVAATVIVIVALETRPLTRRLDVLAQRGEAELQREDDDHEQVNVGWHRTEQGWPDEQARLSRQRPDGPEDKGND